MTIDKDAIKDEALEEGWTDNDLKNLESLCRLIDDCGVTGATKQQIRSLELSGVKLLPLEILLQFALDKFLVLEVRFYHDISRTNIT